MNKTALAAAILAPRSTSLLFCQPSFYIPWLSLIFFYCNYFVVIVLAEEDVSFSSPESNDF